VPDYGYLVIASIPTQKWLLSDEIGAPSQKQAVLRPSGGYVGEANLVDQTCLTCGMLMTMSVDMLDMTVGERKNNEERDQITRVAACSPDSRW
jgi:hypothetical protein